MATKTVKKPKKDAAEVTPNEDPKATVPLSDLPPPPPPSEEPKVNPILEDSALPETPEARAERMSPKPFVERPPLSDAERIAESRKVLNTVLPDDQQFFEAPDGFVMVGDKDKPHAWYRQGNGGKGCNINPMRLGGVGVKSNG